jgi:hypothetical protein
MRVILRGLINCSGRLVENVEEVVDDRVNSVGKRRERRRERGGAGVDHPRRSSNGQQVLDGRAHQATSFRWKIRLMLVTK